MRVDPLPEEVACPARQTRGFEEARCIGSGEPIKSLPTQSCQHQRLDRQRRATFLRVISGIVDASVESCRDVARSLSVLKSVWRLLEIAVIW